MIFFQFNNFLLKMSVISLKELSKHNTEEDCWVCISGYIYDITELLNTHTSGEGVLLKLASKDVTKDFKIIGHNNRQLKKLIKTGHVLEGYEKLLFSRNSIFDKITSLFI